MTTEERLEKLEEDLIRSKRHNRLLLMAAVSIVSAVFLLGASGDVIHDVIRTKELLLVDVNGNTRAMLNLADGQPGLSLFDETGKERAALALLRSGQPMLSLYDRANVLRAVLDLDDSGQPGLSLNDENSKYRVWLSLGLGQPGLILFDENQKGGVTLYLDKSGRPDLWLSDENGKTRASLDLTESGQPALTLDDENGNERASLGATGTTTTDGRKVSYPESSLLLFGQDGKLVWQAP